MIENERELLNALQIGAPLEDALRYAGISPADFSYWESVDAAVVLSLHQDEMERLKKTESDAVVNAKKRAFAEAMGGRREADPELVVRYRVSKTFRKEADNIHALMEKCAKAKSKAVMKHLKRIYDDGTPRAAVTASQWYLERALPDSFGRKDGTQPIEAAKPEPIKVEFVKPSSDSLKRIEEIEAELLGDKNRA